MAQEIKLYYNDLRHSEPLIRSLRVDLLSSLQKLVMSSVDFVIYNQIKFTYL